jgi:LacI family transcriptional regulator
MAKTKTGNSTILDVARKAGVSVATVSRALNNPEVVAAETVTLVQRVIQELDYQPDSAARSLRAGKTNTIGLLVDTISGEYFTPLLNGIEACTSQAGYNLLIFTSGRQGPRKAVPASLGYRNTDGIMIFADSLEHTSLVQYYQRNLPMVLIHGRAPDGLPIPCVTIENRDAAQMLVEHLIQVHHRRHIAFLSGPGNQEHSYWREIGYRKALSLHGIPFRPELVAPGNFDHQVAAAAVKMLLASGEPMDAIFAGDDGAAAGALSALQAAGLQVPEQIAVVGFDDQPLASYLTPPLTTIHAPTEQVGYEAARQLITLIQQGQADPLTLLPTQMIIRRSCGCNIPATGL